MALGTLWLLQYKIPKRVYEDVQMSVHGQAVTKRKAAPMLTSSIPMLPVGWKLVKGI